MTLVDKIIDNGGAVTIYDKMDVHGHINTAHCERLSKKPKVMRY